MHLLALRISTYLSLRGDAVLKHWASAKIAHSKPSGLGEEADDEVCRVIVEKCGKDVSYAEIAKRAWEVGRTGLATKVGQSCVTLDDHSYNSVSFWTTNPGPQTRFPYYCK